MVKASVKSNQAKALRATKAPMSLLESIRQLEEEIKSIEGKRVSDETGDEDDKGTPKHDATIIEQIESDEAVKKRISEVQGVTEDIEKYQSICESLLSDLNSKYDIPSSSVFSSLNINNMDL
eukprot:gnl/Chilomastix_caulleri/2345.p1 GENE.gnl/Chilomastix_caulleri/2345~~gnl/Chilomastix_caulleri/2345.p1  ORF type:complete len:122 (+),score=25.56 gnl/Chilomastix_caulleri/2345:271-636(+)